MLNLNQFRVKRVFKEAEMIIDFPEEVIMPPDREEEISDGSNPAPQQQLTNIASNRTASERNDQIDREIQQEIEQARQLVKDVSQQLGKKIPTIENLKMPVETTDGLDPDSLKRKLYTGDSNIEYYLDNRYHLRLPKPIYLAHEGGKVEVRIVVNRQGVVIEAEPIVSSELSELILSYAKTAALQTIFNNDPKAPQKQFGKITYRFIAQ